MRRLILAVVTLGLGLSVSGGPPRPPAEAAVSRPATAEEFALLRDAFGNSTQEMDRWAYTETSRRAISSGRPLRETVIRFDPSKPYAEQHTPLRIYGRPPTEKQKEDYRKRGERRGERIARAAEAARRGQPPLESTFKIGNRTTKLDLTRARVLAEEPDRLTYAIPLVGRPGGIPLDKFQLTVRVKRSRRILETLTFTLHDSFRVKLIAKVKGAVMTQEYTQVDERYGPVLSRRDSSFNVSVLLKNMNGESEQTRSDWKRVKPYDERFEVRLGPLNFLNFEEAGEGGAGGEKGKE